MALRHKVLTAVSAATLAFSAGAYAQAVSTDTSATVPGHPRVSEVNTRLDNQQNRVDAGVAAGTITPKQAGRDETRDARIEQRADKDEAKNGGHLTKREDRRLNKSLDKNSADIKAQKAN